MTRRVSVWGGGFWLSRKVRDAALDAARELEELGYSRLWTSGGLRAGFPVMYGELLDTTKQLEVASDIVRV